MGSFKPSYFICFITTLAAAVLGWWLNWALQAPPGVTVRVPEESVTSQSAILCWQPLSTYATQIVDYNIYVNGLQVGRASEQNQSGICWQLPSDVSGFDASAVSSGNNSANELNNRTSTADTNQIPLNWYLTGLEDYTDYLVEVEPLLADGKRLARTTYEFMTPQNGEVLYSILNGARGDGISDDTIALQKAIDACPPGGTVYFNEGTYLCGPLYLHNDLTLYLPPQAKILARAQNQPPTTKVGPSSIFALPSLFTASKGRKIQLKGGGTLDAQHQPLELIHFQDVENFLIEDLTFLNTAQPILGLENCRQGIINKNRLGPGFAESKLYTRNCQGLLWLNNIQIGS